jgi:hypothetical protein
MPITK